MQTMYNWATGRQGRHNRSTSEAQSQSAASAAAVQSQTQSQPRQQAPIYTPGGSGSRSQGYSSNVPTHQNGNGTARGGTGTYAPAGAPAQGGYGGHGHSQSYGAYYAAPQQQQPQTSSHGRGYTMAQPQAPAPQYYASHSQGHAQPQPRQSSRRERAQSYPASQQPQVYPSHQSQPQTSSKRREREAAAAAAAAAPQHQPAQPPRPASRPHLSPGGLSQYSPQGAVPDGRYYTTDFLLGCSMVTFQPATQKVVVVYERGRKYWFLPKGRKDVGESLEQCALREAWEESGYRTTFLPVYNPTCAPHSPAVLAKRPAGSANKAVVAKNTEAFYMHMAAYGPKYAKQLEGGMRKMTRGGGEYLTFYYIGQIAADAVRELGTGMEDEGNYEGHLLPYEEALRVLKPWPHEHAALERAWTLWRQTVAWDEYFKNQRAAASGSAPAAGTAGAREGDMQKEQRRRDKGKTKGRADPAPLMATAVSHDSVPEREAAPTPDDATDQAIPVPAPRSDTAGHSAEVGAGEGADGGWQGEEEARAGSGGWEDGAEGDMPSPGPEQFDRIAFDDEGQPATVPVDTFDGMDGEEGEQGEGGVRPWGSTSGAERIEWDLPPERRGGGAETGGAWDGDFGGGGTWDPNPTARAGAGGGGGDDDDGFIPPPPDSFPAEDGTGFSPDGEAAIRGTAEADGTGEPGDDTGEVEGSGSGSGFAFGGGDGKKKKKKGREGEKEEEEKEGALGGALGKKGKKIFGKKGK